MKEKAFKRFSNSEQEKKINLNILRMQLYLLDIFRHSSLGAPDSNDQSNGFE